MDKPHLGQTSLPACPKVFLYEVGDLRGRKGMQVERILERDWCRLLQC
jgi:hypothetical protein